MDTQTAPLTFVVAETLLDCGHPESEHSGIARGYGVDSAGKKHCYACCAEQDRQQMRDTGKILLYFTKDNGRYYVSNWPGSLKIQCGGVRKSWHNIGRVRFDFWFYFEGKEWHGYQIGECNEIAHCKRNK